MFYQNVADYAARLASLGPPVDTDHLQAANSLAQWIDRQRRNGRNAPVIFVCTGNSRRSVLGAVLGNVAAEWFGHAHVRCYSGGTSPTAVNSRTTKALERVGVLVQPTGSLASPGLDALENPVYRFQWGTHETATETADGSAPGSMMEDFSKHYSTPPNPASGFAAILVCSDADHGCPNVMGADIRIVARFHDPKDFDGTDREEQAYSDRRDQIGQFAFWAFRRLGELAET